MGVVDEAIENRVGIGRIADDLMPFVDGDLAGEDGRASAIAFFEDLVEIAPRAAVERVKAPIVEDEELNAIEAVHDPGMAPIAASQGEIGEELGDALIKDRAVVAAGLVAESTGKPTLSDAGRATKDQIVVRVDPLAVDELVEQGAVEAAWGSVIDVLDDSMMAQPGITQPGGKALVATIANFAIDEQAEPIGMAEGRSFAGGFEFDESLGHAGKPELGELVKHWMGQHCPFSLMVVAGSADVGVEDRNSVGWRPVRGLTIELVVEDRAHRAVGQRADLDGAYCRRFETIGAERPE